METRCLLLILGFGLSVPLALLAEPPDPKADKSSESRFEAEANLPIYHRPVKSIALSKNQNAKNPVGFPELQPNSPKPTLVPGPAMAEGIATRRRQAKLSDSFKVAPVSSKPLIPPDLDSLAQSQDKARQAARFGDGQTLKMMALRLAPIESEKTLPPKPVIGNSPETNLKNPFPQSPAGNPVLGIRNDSVPHRGPGPASISGTTNVSAKNGGINGTGMARRR
jgi:hypothetical protein